MYKLSFEDSLNEYMEEALIAFEIEKAQSAREHQETAKLKNNIKK